MNAILKFILASITIFFLACTNFSQRSRFTEEQIKSLGLDSTTVLNASTDSLETVDLNPFLDQPLNFDLESRIEELKIVPLETTDESLLDAIYKIIVTDSHIYIYDRLKGGGLAIFDNEGRFIKRLPYGSGPGDIYRLLDVAYDEQNNQLVLFQPPFLFLYTPVGEYIEQKRLPFLFYNFCVVPNGYLFKTLDSQGNEHLGELKDHTLLVTDKNFKIDFVSMPYYYNINHIGFNHFYNNYTLKVTQRFSDTIYQYSPNTNHFQAKYALDYTEKKLPTRLIEAGVNEFEIADKSGKYYHTLGEYLETKHHNAFFLMNNWYRTIIYRDKNSKKMIGGTHPLYDNVKQVPPMTHPIATYKEYFISTHSPSPSDSSFVNSSLLSGKSKQALLNAKEDDNPSLVFFKLKDL